jgi:hypothetical protein
LLCYKDRPPHHHHAQAKCETMNNIRAVRNATSPGGETPRRCSRPL